MSDENRRTADERRPVEAPSDGISVTIGPSEAPIYLPAGTYRVIDAQLVRIEPGIPPDLRPASAQAEPVPYAPPTEGPFTTERLRYVADDGGNASQIEVEEMARALLDARGRKRFLELERDRLLAEVRERRSASAPLTGAQLAAKHGFKPHGLDPAQALGGPAMRPWVNEALNRLMSGDEPDSAIPMLRQALSAVDGPCLESAQGEPTITLPLSPNEDTEVTCLYCRAPRPCEYGLRIRRQGETALVGLHATCLEPFRARQRPGSARRDDGEEAKTSADVERTRGVAPAGSEAGERDGSDAEARTGAAPAGDADRVAAPSSGTDASMPAPFQGKVYGVFLRESTTPHVPTAVFTYGDQAANWARDSYHPWGSPKDPNRLPPGVEVVALPCASAEVKR